MAPHLIHQRNKKLTMTINTDIDISVCLSLSRVTSQEYIETPQLIPLNQTSPTPTPTDHTRARKLNSCLDS